MNMFNRERKRKKNLSISRLGRCKTNFSNQFSSPKSKSLFVNCFLLSIIVRDSAAGCHEFYIYSNQKKKKKQTTHQTKHNDDDDRLINIFSIDSMMMTIKHHHHENLNNNLSVCVCDNWSIKTNYLCEQEE